MAIAVVSTGSAIMTTSTTATIQLSVPDPNAVIIVGMGFNTGAALASTVQWDSTTPSSAFTVIGQNANNAGVSLFGTLNPSTGTHDILISQASTTVLRAIAVVVYSGVDSSALWDTATLSTTASAASSNAASTAIPSSAADLIISALCVRSSQVATPGNGGTLRVATAASAANIFLSETPGAATAASSFTWTTASINGFVAVNLHAAAAGGASPSLPLARRGLMGIGR